MYEIEIEYKQLLTQDEYKRLKEYFLKENALEEKQVNYYFETSNLALKNKKKALRIREKNNSYILCLKTKREKDILEENIEISEKEFCDILNNPKLLNEYYSDLVEDIEYLGYLTTYRIEAKKDKGLLCLDKSEYNSIVDYEIEFEAVDYDLEEYFKEFLETYDIVYKKNDVSKIGRFMRSLK